MKIFTVLLIVSSCIVDSIAQTGFSRDTNIPVSNSGGQLEMPWAGGLDFPNFSEIDLNNDGLMDLFAFDQSNNHVITFVNTGTGGIHCWRYAPQYADMFPILRSWAFLYDYNCDNKPDLFTCDFKNHGISQYRNDSQGQTLLFTLVDSTMDYDTGGLPGNIPASRSAIPNFNDIDNDGDMDIIGQYYSCPGGFAYYKNLSMENYGVCDSLNDYVVEHNVWGDFVVRTGAYSNVIVDSTGWNVSCQVLKTVNPNNIPGNSYATADRDDTYASIFTIDIDDDGDKDALIGDSGANNSLLLINGGDSSHATMVSQDTLYPSYNLSVYNHSYVMHAYADGDNDGIKDIIISNQEWENNHGVQLYHNTNTTAVPHISHVQDGFLQNQMIDVGEGATPVFIDADGDGLKDLLIGNKYRTLTDSTFETTLTLYKNTGTVTSPAFTWVTNDFAGIKSLNLLGPIVPAFGDLDQDSDMDMIIGLDDGSLIWFENIAGPGAALAFASPVYNYSGIDVGQAATPQLIDLNRDGYTDLVIGNKYGLLTYFENSQSTTSPFTSVATIDTLGGIKLRYPGSTDGYVVPFVFDQNGDHRMVVSYLGGEVYLYGNIDNNLNGNFTLLDSLVHGTDGNNYGFNLCVSGGDLNGDSLTDLVFGLYSGGVQIYYQDNLANGVGNINNDNQISVYPNPASDKLVIKTPVNVGTCSLHDISGRTILNTKIQGGYGVMNVSDVVEGVYFVSVISNKIVSTRTVLISR